MCYGCYYLKNLIYKIVLLLSCSIFLNAIESSKVQFEIENQLEDRVISKEIKSLIFDVIQFYDNKNSLKMNEILYKDIGLYFIFDTYHHERFWNSKKICFFTCKEEYFPLSYFYEELNKQKILKNKQIKKTIYIRNFPRKRLFKVIQKTIERLQIDRDLTKGLKKELLKEITNVEKWERDSIEVILMYKNSFEESAFRFFITKIEKKWYLTIIDFTSTNIFSNAHINTPTYKSLYSFCKSTGIKESEIRALNPWINKKATNIPPNAEIIIPNLNKEKNNESK
jgi:hypothetical protein